VKVSSSSTELAVQDLQWPDSSFLCQQNPKEKKMEKENKKKAAEGAKGNKMDNQLQFKAGRSAL